MNPTHSRTVIAVVATLASTGCAIDSRAYDAIEHRISYAAPPVPGQRVHPQSRLVACRTANAALATAASGLFADGCAALGDRDDFRVVARRHVSLDEGGVWLVKLDNGRRHAWMPVPWHDWA